MMTGGSGARIQMEQVQDTATVNKTITQNDWETVLDTTKNCIIYNCSFVQATANEDIELEITDSVGTETLTQAAVAGTTYYLAKRTNTYNDNRYQISTSDLGLYQAGIIWDRTIKIRVRKTSATGANNHKCFVRYSKIP